MTPIETALASKVVGSSVGPAKNLLSRIGASAYNRLIVQYTRAFDKYMARSMERASVVKNILYRDQTAKTLDKYVHLTFTGESRISDDELINKLINSGRICVTASAGSGKSMFSKWVTLNLAANIQRHQKIPILIELREIDRIENDDDFLNLAFRKIASRADSTTFDQFILGAKEGLFIFILDALDEVDRDNRSRLISLLHDFCIKYNESSVLITSRDMVEISHISNLSRYELSKMTMPQIIQVVEKLNYEPFVTQEFIKRIKSDLYSSHTSFLSNPLLATIMLLTFDQSKEIPLKRSLFYRKAFEALYERHDNHKGIYKRDLYAKLNIEEFENIFSTFCYGTYINHDSEFSELELRKFIKASLRICEIDADEKDVVQDCIESACLIVRDGLSFTFSHRSFQEYFTAVFISKYRRSDISKVINEMAAGRFADNVLDMLFEIDRGVIDRNFVLPHLKRFNKKLEGLDLNKPGDVFSALKVIITSLDFSPESGDVTGVLINYWDMFSFMSVISGFYEEAHVVRDIFGETDEGARIFNKGSYYIEKYPKNKSVLEFLDAESGHYDEVSIDFNSSDLEWVIDSSVRQYVERVFSVSRRLEIDLNDRYKRLNNKSNSLFADFSR